MVINMMKKLYPTISLTVVVLIITLLLNITYNLTYKDTSLDITKDLQIACEKIFGSDVTFEIIPNNLVENKVKKIVKTSDGRLAFEVVTKGYAKDGIDLTVGFDSNGNIIGVQINALAETPGIGTKVNEKSFLEQFSGKNNVLSIAKKNVGENEVAAITGATYSTKGVVNAVNTAVCAYSEYVNR